MSFLNPLFFLGLAALAAPVLVHLVRRTRARRVQFPSLMFVRRVPQNTIRRKRLHNLLLLALRCLALFLFVAAFTRPYLSAGDTAERRARASVILLDTSLSMRLGAGAKSHFDRAKAQARALLGEARGGEQFALVGFDQSYTILSPWTAEAAQLQTQLAGLRPGLGGTDYEQALSGAEELLTGVRASEKRIFLISDFQATGWKNPGSSFRLSRDIKLIPILADAEPVPNLAVSDVSVRPVSYQQKYGDKLRAQIISSGDEAQEGIEVELQINDQTVEKRRLAIPAHGSAPVEFTGFNLMAGDNRCVLVVGGNDEFTLDNRFYMTLRREAQWKLLIIENATRGGGESLFLRNALTAGENLPFTLTVKTPGSTNPDELSNYRVVMINDAAGLNPSLAAGIERFVGQGGGLIIAAGRHTEAGQFNRELRTVAPSELGETAQSRGGASTITAVKTDHPVFEVFPRGGGLGVAQVFAYHRSEPRDRALVLARFGDGSPALVETSAGRGKVLMWTSTLDTAWTDLPLTPLYLPLIRQMVGYLGEPTPRRAWHTVGQAFTAQVAADGTPPAVDTPAGTRLTERRSLTTAGDLIIIAREPGFYRLRYPDRTEFAAVNLDGKESDLTRLNTDEFVAAVTNSGGDNAASPSAREAAPAPAAKLSEQEIETRRGVWWPLLLVALLLFVAEAMLARRTRMRRIIG